MIFPFNIIHSKQFKILKDMYKVIAHSDEFIYVLDTINNRLRSYQLNHSPGHLEEEFHRLPKVKNFKEAMSILNK